MEQKTEASQAVDELLPCPFCGGAARIESNRDWHRLYADHDESCVFDDEGHALMYPAQPGYLLEIVQVWNRRAALKAQPAPTEAAQGSSNSPEFEGIAAQGEDSARLDAAGLATIEEATKVLESGAKHNSLMGRTVFADVQRDRAVRLRAILDRARASAETGGVKP